jgi:hypothetical protein
MGVRGGVVSFEVRRLLELCGSMAQHSNPMYMYSSSPPRD